MTLLCLFTFAPRSLPKAPGSPSCSGTLGSTKAGVSDMAPFARENRSGLCRRCRSLPMFDAESALQSCCLSIQLCRSSQLTREACHAESFSLQVERRSFSFAKCFVAAHGPQIFTPRPCKTEHILVHIEKVATLWAAQTSSYIQKSWFLLSQQTKTRQKLTKPEKHGLCRGVSAVFLLHMQYPERCRVRCWAKALYQKRISFLVHRLRQRWDIQCLAELCTNQNPPAALVGALFSLQFSTRNSIIKCPVNQKKKTAAELLFSPFFPQKASKSQSTPKSCRGTCRKCICLVVTQILKPKIYIFLVDWLH